MTVLFSATTMKIRLSLQKKLPQSLDVSEKKTEPVKAEIPVKAPVEDTEVSDDRMSEIDKLLKELEDKK